MTQLTGGSKVSAAVLSEQHSPAIDSPDLRCVWFLLDCVLTISPDFDAHHTTKLLMPWLVLPKMNLALPRTLLTRSPAVELFLPGL